MEDKKQDLVLSTTAFAGISAAIAGGLGTFQRAADDAIGAADTGIDFDCIDWTVQCACSAFHTGVNVGDGRFSVRNFKDRVRTDGRTQSAAYALVNIQLKSGYIFKIFQAIHFLSPIK